VDAVIRGEEQLASALAELGVRSAPKPLRLPGLMSLISVRARGRTVALPELAPGGIRARREDELGAERVEAVHDQGAKRLIVRRDGSSSMSSTSVAARPSAATTIVIAQISERIAPPRRVRTFAGGPDEPPITVASGGRGSAAIERIMDSSGSPYGQANF